MDSYHNFHPDTHLRTPESKFWTPNHQDLGFRASEPAAPQWGGALVGCECELVYSRRHVLGYSVDSAVGVMQKRVQSLGFRVQGGSNFGTPHIFFLYPKKLSYSSRNTYIKKIRVRPLGKASCLLKNLKNKYKLMSFFGDVQASFKMVNSVAAGYHPLTHAFALIAIPAPDPWCGGIIEPQE